MKDPALALAVDAPHGEHPNQFSLLKQRRFAPFLWTQLSGAANGNLFKFALTVMVTYQLTRSLAMTTSRPPAPPSWPATM
jgi:hypothetical protein